MLLALIPPATAGQGLAGGTAAIFVAALSSRIAHHSQAHPLLLKCPHEVTSMMQKGVEVVRLGVVLNGHGLQPEDEITAFFPKALKPIFAIHDIRAKSFRKSLRHKLDDNRPLPPHSGRAGNEASPIRHLHAVVLRFVRPHRVQHPLDPHQTRGGVLLQQLLGLMPLK